MKDKRKILWALVFMLPFFLGVAGFSVEGKNIIDAAYDSFALYFVNPMYDDKNIFIEISRWLAPAVMASGFIVFVKEMRKEIRNYFAVAKESTYVIYGESADIPVVKKCLGDAIVSDGEVIGNSDNHIIMFNNDVDAFNFYDANKLAFKGKNVIIKSDSIDMFANDNDNFRVVNFNEIIARNYWLENNLIKFFFEQHNEIHIAIIGLESLGKKIMDYAILNNIYSLEQKITYHIWGDSLFYRQIHADLNLMNNDEIVYHTGDWQSDIAILSQMNRIIFPSTPDLQTVFMLADKCVSSEIHCYNLEESVLAVIGKSNVSSFGKKSGLINAENLLLSDIYSSAKQANFDYVCSENKEGVTTTKEEEWDKLDNFTKGSNIYAAVYNEIRGIIEQEYKPKNTETNEEFKEMEHIRWCRYHFLNHWQYGKTSNGKKDPVNKIHPLLVPYGELNKKEQKKDDNIMKSLEKASQKINI